MPWTEEGERELSVELADVADAVTPPGMVWWWCVQHLVERRGTLYGYRDDGAERLALIVTRRFPGESGRLADEVLWVPARHVRARFE